MTPAQMALERARPSIARRIQEKWAAKKSNQHAQSGEQNKDTAFPADAPPANTKRQIPIDSRGAANQPVLPITVKESATTKSIAPLVKAADLEREQLEQEKQDDEDLREVIERDGEKHGKFSVLNNFICLIICLTCIFTVFRKFFHIM